MVVVEIRGCFVIEIKRALQVVNRAAVFVSNDDTTSFSMGFFTGVVGEASNDVSDASSSIHEFEFETSVDSGDDCTMMVGFVMMWSGRLMDDGNVVSGTIGLEGGKWLLSVSV